jgi:hypothetical protein
VFSPADYRWTTAIKAFRRMDDDFTHVLILQIPVATPQDLVNTHEVSFTENAPTLCNRPWRLRSEGRSR